MARTLSIVLLLCWATVGPAEVVRWSGLDPEQQSLTVADGLSDSTVFAITQDRYGRIWIGTGSGGVNLYDGHGFRTFVAALADGALSHGSIGTLRSHSSGDLFVGTWGGGLERLSIPDMRFEQIAPPGAPPRIQSLYEDRQGRLWVGSEDSGLFVLDRPDGQLEAVPVPDAEGSARIWSIAQGPDGDLWVATSGGLMRLDGGDHTAKAHIEIQGDHPRALLAGADRLWVGNNSGLHSILLSDPSLLLQSADVALPSVNTVAWDHQGRILAGTFSGLQVLRVESGGAVVRIGEERFGGKNIRDIHVDDTGVIWLATRESGVIRMHEPDPSFDGFSTGGRPGAVTTIAELAADDLLMGSRAGLWRLKNGPWGPELTLLGGTEDWTVNCLVRLGADVLIGTRNGLYRFDAATDQIVRDPRFRELGDVFVMDVAADGSIWVGTWGDGAYHFPAGQEADRHLHAGSEPALAGDFVSAIATPEAGNGLWFGHWNEGVTHVREDGQVIRYSDQQPPDRTLPPGPVYSLQAVADTIFAATSFGFVSINPAEQEVVEINLARDELPVSVKWIEPDQAGRLWMSTTRGLRRYDPQTEELLFFGAADGLTTTEFMLRSGHSGASGRFYFGGVGGFVSLDPDNVAPASQPPQAVITGVAIDGQLIDHTSGIISMPPGAAEVRFHYRATDNRSMAENQHRVQLQGHDATWSEPRATGRSSYSGLRPGQYRFRLKAANSNGVWSTSEASLDLIVIPYWWQTWLGRAGVVLGLLLIAYLWLRIRTSRILAINRQLEARVADQMEALKVANQTLRGAARTDYLTGLPNRRGFTEDVEAFFGEGFIALGDIDNFKSFNDTFGHDVGDVALKHVARAFQSVMRPKDLVGRWGGEEFIFFLAGGSRDEAIAIAESIRHAATDHRLEVKGHDIPPMTITIGVARRKQGEELADVVARADKRLYQGKQAGKNRVVGR